MRRHSLKTSTLLVILPIVLASVIALSVLGYTAAKRTILEAAGNEMSLSLNNEIESIEKSLSNNAMVAETVARAVEVNREHMEKADYGSLITSFVKTNDETFGGGIWFEPYAFSPTEQYFSPYCMRENGNVVYVQDYSLGEGISYTDQDWYASAKNTSESVVWSAPYYDDYVKISMVTSTAPFYSESGKLLGVTTTDIDLTQMQKMVSSFHARNTGRTFLIDGMGTYIADEDSEKLLKANILQDANSSLAELGKTILSEGSGTGSYLADGENYLVWYNEIPGTGWIVVASIAENDLLSGVNALGGVLAVIAIVTAVIVCALLVIFISRKVVRPLERLAKVTGAIAAGDLDVEISYHSQDEIGVVCESMGQTVVRLKSYISYIDEVSAVLGKIADGNLNFSLQQEYSGEFLRLKTALLRIQSNLVETIRDIVQASERVSTGAREISDATQTLSEGSMSQSASAEEISGNVEEVQNLIGDSAQNLSLARERSDRVAEAIVQDDRRMQEMAKAMEEIGSTSAEISKIIQTVEGIAFQTNILALNAAVEAARAGAAGKGFAVVADEVRNLANKSSEASRNTAELIQRSLQAVEQGKRIANETTQAIKQMVSDVEETAGIVKSVSDRAAEEVRFIASVTEAVEQVAGVISSNSAMSQETAAKCAELFEESKQLQRTASRFRVDGIQKETNTEGSLALQS